MFFYTARYGGGSDLGCAASNPECLVLDPPLDPSPLDPPLVNLPSTGFSKRGIANVLTNPEASPFQTTNMTLEIPNLKIQMPIIVMQLICSMSSKLYDYLQFHFLNHFLMISLLLLGKLRKLIYQSQRQRF